MIKQTVKLSNKLTVKQLLKQNYITTSFTNSKLLHTIQTYNTKVTLQVILYIYINNKLYKLTLTSLSHTTLKLIKSEQI